MHISYADKNISQIITAIHGDCHGLCSDILHQELPVAGNVAIFSRSDEEFSTLEQMRKVLCLASSNPLQKYFELRNPIIVNHSTYTHLYVRRPAEDSPERGDVDFVADTSSYERLKARVEGGDFPGASIYDRPGWDMIELRKTGIDAIAYVSKREMALKVRVKFTEAQ